MPLNSILKTSLQLANTLIFNSVNNNQVSIDGENNEKLVKSKKYNFIKAVYRVEKPSFLTSNTRQIFN